MLTDDQKTELLYLESQGQISTADKNLRSKIDSILRSLENLSNKKLRLEFEIKKQKKSLYRKRQELKRVTRSNQKKVSLTLESGDLPDDLFDETDLRDLRRLDSILLEESSRQLDD